MISLIVIAYFALCGVVVLNVESVRKCEVTCVFVLGLALLAGALGLVSSQL